MPSLHHTGLTVRDLERSRAFYEGVLGMEPVMEVQERRGGYWGAIVGYEDVEVRFVHLAFEGSGHRLELVEYRNPPARGEAGEPRDVGVTHACFLVPDLDEIAERLRAAGGEAYSDPVTVTEGPNTGGRALYARDPDGITIELFQGPGGGG